MNMMMIVKRNKSFKNDVLLTLRGQGHSPVKVIDEHESLGSKMCNVEWHGQYD